MLALPAGEAKLMPAGQGRLAFQGGFQGLHLPKGKAGIRLFVASLWSIDFPSRVGVRSLPSDAHRDSHLNIWNFEVCFPSQ